MLAMRKAVHGVVFALALGACAWFAIHGALAAHNSAGSDFTIYYDAGRAVLDGRDPYGVLGFIYLPFFAVCMAPLALLPYSVAVIVWQLASFVLLAWIARACVALVRADDMPAPAWLAWAPLVCVLRLADSNLANGQVNVFTLACLVLAVRAWLSRSEGRAGTWSGLASALKIVPGCIALVFIVRGSWRALVTWGLVTLACVFVLPSFVTGFSANAAQLHEWMRADLRPFNAGGAELLAQRDYLPGQSLTPVFYRLLSRTGATARGEAGPSVNVADLDPESTKWIVRAAELAWLAVTFASLVRSKRKGQNGARMREVALVLTCALSVAPLVHKAHMVWLIVPYAVLLAGTPSGMSRGTARIRWILIALSVAFIGLSTPALFGRALATSLLSHNAVFFGLQSVFAALLVDVWSARAAPHSLSGTRTGP